MWSFAPSATRVDAIVRSIVQTGARLAASINGIIDGNPDTWLVRPRDSVLKCSLPDSSVSHESGMGTSWFPSDTST